MIWDYLFLEGRVILSKVAIGLLAIMYKDIVNQTNFEDIYRVFNEKPSQIKINEQLFYFINTKQYEFDDDLLSKFRDILQRPIIENLQIEKQKRNEKNQKLGGNHSNHMFNKKKTELQCNPNWPICNHDTSVYGVPETIVLKYQKRPKIMIDYYYRLANNYPKSNSRIDEFLLNEDKDVLIERRRHSCLENKIIENSVVFLESDREIDDGMNDSNGSSSDRKEENIYDIIKQGEHFKTAMTKILNNYSPEPIKYSEIRNLGKG